MSNQARCSDKPWGFLATSVPDPPSCVAECRKRFLAGLSPLPSLETFDVVCELLSDNQRDTSALWDLYCCDSQLCGVNNLASRGEDPNVNWLINTCQNNGYHAIADPGPPDRAFSCSRKSVLGDDPGCETPSSAATTSSFTSMATSTYSVIHDPSLGADIDTSGRDEVGVSGGMSTGIKVTIALSVLAAAVLVVIALAFLLRRRRHSTAMRSNLRDYIRHPTLNPPQADSPTPLISPTAAFDEPPLSPPPPLKERKLHPVGSRLSSSSTVGGKPPLQNTAGFPVSPIYSPVRGKLVPRPEHCVAFAASPPLSPITWFVNNNAGSVDVGSLRSLSSIPTTTSGDSDRTVTAKRHKRRRHGASITIPSPGPPPNKALPSTPRSGVTSPPTSPRRPGDIGVAMGMVRHNPSQGVTLDTHSKDLYDLTEAYGQDKSRGEAKMDRWNDSWGSQPGGVAPLSPKGRGGQRDDTQGHVMLEDGELERLAGTY